MVAIDRKHIQEITYILACIHDSKGIPTAIPMFSGSRYMIILLRGMPDVRNFVRNQRCHFYFRLMAVINVFAVMYTAELYVISNVLPDNGHHL